MVFDDANDIIYKNFGDEFYSSVVSDWHVFVLYKNLGLTYIGHSSNHRRRYKIVDQNKWILARLKYGI